MRKGLVLLIFVLLFFVGSCGGDDSSKKSGIGESCTKTSDCEDDLICIDLVCLDDPEDTGDTENTGTTCTGDDMFCHSHGGIDWSDVSNSYKSWYTAKIYCENLGGRLPTISELRTLIQNCPGAETDGECSVTDSCLSEGCWNDACSGCEYDESGKYSVFGDTSWFWSSSEVSDETGSIWRVIFLYGSIVNCDKDLGLVTNVRCVRLRNSVSLDKLEINGEW